MKENILLTFTGFHDPYFKGLIDQEEQKGPILSLLSAVVLKKSSEQKNSDSLSLF